LKQQDLKKGKTVDTKRECNKNAGAETELIMIDFAYLPQDKAN
jgi:hypothetical protein